MACGLSNQEVKDILETDISLINKNFFYLIEHERFKLDIAHIISGLSLALCIMSFFVNIRFFGFNSLFLLSIPLFILYIYLRNEYKIFLKETLKQQETIINNIKNIKEKHGYKWTINE